MNSLTPKYRYAVVSPAKDEEAYASKTIESLIGQTVHPVRWVIVDDGSRDRTSEIAESYAKKFLWIQVEQIHRDPARHPGPAVVAAFNSGLKKLEGIQYDFLVKLDMDLILPPDYFEQILGRFVNDPSLGIASGVYMENWDGEWKTVSMPEYHAAGASKVMRRKCFEEIDGYAPEIGWDTVDEIRAMARGWKTKHFPDLPFQHLRQEGRGVGLLRNNQKNGVAYYLMGGGIFFLLFKIPFRMVTTKPRILGGLALLWGYLRCLLSGRKRLVSADEGKLYRRLLHGRLTRSLQKSKAESVPASEMKVS